MPTLAIIAPSAYAPKPEQVERAISRLQQRGWTVKNLVNIESRYQRFSSDEATRLAQLYQAIDDPEVDVVMALRGGYGLSRLLDQIDFARLAASAKLLVGFSDFTALQLGLLAQTGAISFAGPMIYDDLGSEVLQDFTFEHLERCLFYPQVAFTSQASGNPNCEIEGVFWGGNLAMLVHLIGTPYLPQVEQGILFIEDVNENPYRVERMILQLHYSGILDRQQALVLGHFSNYRATEFDNGYDFAAMLAYLRSKIKLPIITGLPFGHCPDKVTLPIGALAMLRSDAQGFSLAFTGYPHLSAIKTDLPLKSRSELL